MEFDLGDDQRAFREVARAFAAERLAPFAAEWDETCHFPIDVLREAAKLGFAALYVRDDVGGAGLTRFDAAIVLEELAAACPSTAAFLSIHNMAAWMVDAFGSSQQRVRWLPGLTGMSLVASYCLTEPDSGSDAAALTTSATLDGDHYVLNGTKAFISGGGASDVYLVMARTGGEGPRGISCILVEKDTKGLSFGAPEAKLGWHSQPTTAVILADARVPVANRIGAEGEGFSIAMAGLDGGRVNIAACSLGGARACLERVIAYMEDRRQFGSALSSFQALRFRVADMATDLEAGRLMVQCAARALDADDPGKTRAAAMAKRFATDVGFDIVNQALQLHGGYGYLRDFGIERYLRDLRVHQILEGTNEIMRLIIARSLFEEKR